MQRSVKLNEEWQDFLQYNPDARLIVDAIMSRTGFGHDQVVFYLLEIWVEQNFMPEWQTKFDGSRYPPTMGH